MKWFQKKVKIKKKKKILICIDRDGTLIYDEKYHLGKTNDWKEKIKIMPTVISGLKLLNKITPRIYMITNQPGIAIKNYPLLTLKKGNEVCKYIINKLKEHDGILKGYFLCPHASEEYVIRGEKEIIKLHKNLTCIDCYCVKPKLGMVFDALKKEGFTPYNTKVYVIGDRASDIETGLNIKGYGILVPFDNEPGQLEKVKKMKKKKRIYIAENFLDAAKFIVKKEK